MVATGTYIETHYVVPKRDISLKGAISLAHYEEEEFTPEKRLLLAVLYRAGKDLSYKHKSPEYRYVIQWFMSKSKRPFSYLWICAILNFKPKELFDIFMSEDFKIRSANYRIKDIG